MSFESISKMQKTVIARALGIHPNTVYRWEKKGILKQKLLEAKSKAELFKDFEAVREMKAKKKSEA